MAVSLFDDPTELGKRIGAARGYCDDSYESFASKLGISVPTLRSYERGKLGDYEGSPELRRGLAERVCAASEAPAWMLGLSELARDQAIAELRQAVGALAILATTPDLDHAGRQLLEDELAAAQQWSTSVPPTGEPGTGAENA